MLKQINDRYVLETAKEVDRISVDTKSKRVIIYYKDYSIVLNNTTLEDVKKAYRIME